MKRSAGTRRIYDDDLRRFGLLCLFILALTVLGYLWLGIVMKFEGYPSGNPLIRWNPLALKLRQHGHWSLLLFLIWAITTFLSILLERRLVLRFLSIVLSVAVALVPVLFLIAAWNPSYRPLLIYQGGKQPSQQNEHSATTGATSVSESRHPVPAD